MSLSAPPISPSWPNSQLWRTAPEHAILPVHELHVWRALLRQPLACQQVAEAVDAWRDLAPPGDCADASAMALIRNDILDRYGHATGLSVAVSQCDHVMLVAVSRAIRDIGIDVERVRLDMPVDEMAGGFLDAARQWDLRTTWSRREKAWKFFQFWTTNEACQQAHPSSDPISHCQVCGFSPERDFVAAVAVGGPEADVLYWDWQCQ